MLASGTPLQLPRSCCMSLKAPPRRRPLLRCPPQYRRWAGCPPSRALQHGQTVNELVNPMFGCSRGRRKHSVCRKTAAETIRRTEARSDPDPDPDADPDPDCIPHTPGYFRP